MDIQLRLKHKPHKKSRTQLIRRIVQAAFVLFILAASIRHGLLEGTGTTTASIDALCPFGAVETLWQTLTQGQYIPKTHPSNLVLGIGLLLGVLVSGAAFCGWICPFGTVQDALTWLRNRLSIQEVRLPAQLDRWLRYGRFVTLAVILYMTISTVTLWFANIDPYRTIFGLGWWFEFDIINQWPAYLIAVTILVLSFFIPRFWCKYTCPLGGALSLLSHLSLLRIRRAPISCKGCALCNVSCPVGIDVAQANPTVDTNCIGCLACVDACPRLATLEVKLAPTWADGLRSLGTSIRTSKNA
jgi:polyferredoxin